jgi:hypothetical protein
MMDEEGKFLVATFVVIVVMVAVMIPALSRVSSPEEKAHDYWQLRDGIVRECLQSETYSRDECLRLAAEAKP